VVYGDRALPVEIIDEYRVGGWPDPPESEWMTPSGYVEAGEWPAAAATRGLREETGLRVPPGELTLFDAVTRQVVAGVHGLVLFYALEQATVSGTLAPSSDAGGARFFHPGELAASDRLCHDLHAEPARHR
jgi:ADP-ribose pyrophosphatase YjhB (NUDIX family)